MTKRKAILTFLLPLLGSTPILLLAMFEERIVEYFGRTWWTVLLGVSIAAMVVLSLLPFSAMFKGLFGGKGFNFFWGAGRKAKEIQANGRPASAILVEIGENSGGGTITINDQPYLNLKLQIDDGHSQPYEVSFDTVVPRSAMPQFQPGAMFPVRVDNNDPQTVVYDPEGATRVRAVAASDGFPTVGGEGWTEADRVLLEQEGKDGMVKVLGVEDTGRSEDLEPVVNMTYEAYLPGEEPYTFSKELAMPTKIAQNAKTVVGKTFPARVHPYDGTKMRVDITF